MKYNPQVDDYVKWKNHEGWVYFKCDQSISIELGVKDRSTLSFTPNSILID